MSVQATQVYDFNLSAGGSYQLPVTGEYYRIVSAAGPLSIKEDAGGTCGPLLAGQGMRNRKFTSLTLVDKSGAQNAGQIIVAGSDFIDDRIAGDVMTVKSVKARKGVAFMAAAYQVGDGTSAAQVQLWNPAGSGKTLVVTAVQMSSTGSLHVAKFSSVALAGATTQAPSKVAGGAASVAQVRGATAQQLQMTGAIAINYNAAFSFDDALVIPPGFGLSVGAMDLAAGMGAVFEFFEE